MKHPPIIFASIFWRWIANPPPEKTTLRFARNDNLPGHFDRRERSGEISLSTQLCHITAKYQKKKKNFIFCLHF
ncbi:MAG: hypothetical protein D6785_06685 [Planctomycetota bacterium]|nr:MAG: hypothetical protein D6785_06685 [Planctomycetota bacterium]